MRQKICLKNKEYLTDHRCERTNITAKCKISGAWHLVFHRHFQEQMSVKQGILK